MHESMFESYLQVAHDNDKKASEERQLVQAMKSLPPELLFKIASGESKLSYSALCSEGGSGSLGWVEQFKDTPMFEQALRLEQQSIQLEQMEQQHRAQRDAEREQEPKFWEMQDQIRLQKRLLGLQLASSQLQAAAGSATGAPAPAAPPPSTTEAAGGAAPSQTDGKVAGALQLLAVPAAIGGIAGGVRGHEHGRTLEGALRGAAGAAGGAAVGGLGGGVLGGGIGLGAASGLADIVGEPTHARAEGVRGIGLGGAGLGGLIGGAYGSSKGYDAAMGGIERPHKSESKKKEAAAYQPSEHVQGLLEQDKYVSPALHGALGAGLGAFAGGLSQNGSSKKALIGAGLGALGGAAFGHVVPPKLMRMGEERIMSGAGDDMIHAEQSGALGEMNKAYLDNIHGHEGAIHGAMMGLPMAALGGLTGHELGRTPKEKLLGAALGAGAGGLLGGGTGYLSGKHMETALARNKDLQEQRRAQPDYKHKDKEAFDRAASMGQKLAQLDYDRAVTTNLAAELGSDLAKTALDMGGIANMGRQAAGFLGKNPGAALGAAAGAAGGLAHGLQADQNGQRHIMSGLAQGAAGAAGGALAGHAAQSIGGAMRGGASLGQAATGYGQQVQAAGQKAYGMLQGAAKPAAGAAAAPTMGAGAVTASSAPTQALGRVTARPAPTQSMTGGAAAPAINREAATAAGGVPPRPSSSRPVTPARAAATNNGSMGTAPTQVAPSQGTGANPTMDSVRGWQQSFGQLPQDMQARIGAAAKARHPGYHPEAAYQGMVMSMPRAARGDHAQFMQHLNQMSAPAPTVGM